MRELSLNIMDIVQNSISAQANLIKISIEEADNTLFVEIWDNGFGMTNSQLELAVNTAFSTKSGNNRGRGINIFKNAAINSGGSFNIISEPDKGTIVKAEFNLLNDIALGDICSTIRLLIHCNPDLDFVFFHKVNNLSYHFDTREVKEKLENIPLNNNQVSVWINDYLIKNERIIYGGAANQ